ncbi:MAG: cation-transporting P-type ATPase [Ardenticatenaceae bacterium]|nr:cation-transporting P-type ATPase [Ardenticatenaceae bacterium]HBY93259.1 hypothetical protein [Chloroflexota bacterium]
MDARSINLEHYWSQPAALLLATLSSSPDGLSSAEARERLGQVGPNTLDAREQATALQLFLRQFHSSIILILLFATGVSAVLKDWGDALIILVIGSAVLSFIQEYRANSMAEQLRARVTIKATVLRNGQAQSIPAEEVVPGDVVLLSAGSLVPADGIVSGVCRGFACWGSRSSRSRRLRSERSVPATNGPTSMT